MTNPPARNAPCPCGSGRKYKNCCLGGDRASGLARTLRPNPEEVAAAHPWQVGIIPLALRLDDQPGRRVSVALVTAGGLVLQHEMLFQPLGRIDEVADALQAVVEEAEQRTGVSPLRVEVRHAAVARRLGRRLAVRGVAVASARGLPELDDAARSLAQHLGGADALPIMASAPTWNGWGLSATQCRALFAAAARVRRAEPWKRLGDEPIDVWGDHGAWTAAVMGSGGQHFGLSVYTDARDFEELYAPGVDTEFALENMHGGMITLAFESRGELTREMQREVAAAGWEVADPAGYPVAYTSNTPAGGLDPEAVDVLTALLVAIPDFLDARKDVLGEALAGHRIVWEHEATGVRLAYEVPGGFAWPVPDRLRIGGPQGVGAAPDARIASTDGPGDALDDESTLEAFESHLRESVSAATAAGHARNAAALVAFLNTRQGVPLRAMHEFDLRTFLYAEFPRTRPGYGRTETLPGSLRKFLSFLAQRDGLEFPWAESLLRDRDSLERRVRRAPAGGWWSDDVQDFLADVQDDLDRRAMLLPLDWAGASEPDALPAIGEDDLREEAQRRWLVWRDELIREGVATSAELRDALERRLVAWLDERESGDSTRPSEHGPGIGG